MIAAVNGAEDEADRLFRTAAAQGYSGGAADQLIGRVTGAHARIEPAVRSR